jgi:hypothetical protein
MIAPLLTRLDDGQGLTEISEYLWFELKDHFGLDPGLQNSDAFAARLVARFHSRPS